MNNLFEDIPGDLDEEFFQTLLTTEEMRIERIVSRGNASPAEGWYDQAHGEFVALLTGGARLEFDDGSEKTLKAGDWLVIPPHRRHRVAWTDPDTDSVWLTVHYP